MGEIEVHDDIADVEEEGVHFLNSVSGGSGWQFLEREPTGV